MIILKEIKLKKFSLIENILDPEDLTGSSFLSHSGHLHSAKNLIYN
jgi:hypothetical protein